MYPVVSIAISFDSKAAITVTKASEREFWIKMYSLTTYEQIFEEQIGGGPKQYIKCKEIVQNEAGTKYAICFFDDGKFRFRTFTRQTRSAREIALSEVDVNALVGIDDHTMPI